MRQSRAGAALAILALALSACATKPVTIDGDAIVDPYLIEAANRIDAIETVMVIAGEALLVARGEISADRWEDVKEASAAAAAALDVARSALVEYHRLHTDDSIDNVEKAIQALDFIVTLLVQYQAEAS